MTAPNVSHVERVDLAYSQKPWLFAQARRADIDAHFAARQGRNPALWNGRVLIMQEIAVQAGVLRGAFSETDFASFLAWIDWGRPPAGAWDCFAAAAIVCADNGWLTGLMAPHTANAGQVYFPCGTPDPNDVAGNRVDFDKSLARELTEETGLRVDEFDGEPGWTMAVDGPLVALIKVLRSREVAADLRERVLSHLAREAQPELSDIPVVRGPADLDARMRPYVVEFFKHRWG